MSDSFPGKQCSRFNLNTTVDEDVKKSSCNAGFNKNGGSCAWLSDINKCVSEKKAMRLCREDGKNFVEGSCQIFEGFVGETLWKSVVDSEKDCKDTCEGSYGATHYVYNPKPGDAWNTDGGNHNGGCGCLYTDKTPSEIAKSLTSHPNVRTIPL